MMFHIFEKDYISTIIRFTVLLSWFSLAIGEQLHIPWQNTAELRLLSDSTNSQYWADYGLNCLIRGERAWCLYSLEMGRLYSDSCSHLARTRAAYEYLGNRSVSSLNALAPYTDEPLVSAMLVSILQETGSLSNAEAMLVDGEQLFAEYPGLAGFLRARQHRLVGDTPAASEILDSLTVLNELHPIVSDVILLENVMLDKIAITPDSILHYIYSDIALTAGVYVQHIYDKANQISIIDNALQEVIIELLIILDKKDSAIALVKDFYISDLSHRVITKCAEALISLDRLGEAMELVQTLLDRDSLDSDALAMRGLLLLRAGSYSEAFYEMAIASDLTGCHRCRAIQGLAAEFAGYHRIAVETYAELLSADADSIVVINRIRELALNRDPQDLLRTSTRQAAVRLRRSNLSANLRFSFHSNSGEYESQNLSTSCAFRYKYGLFGSNVSLRHSYRHSKWPETQNDYISNAITLSGMNFTNRTFFQRMDLEWSTRQYLRELETMEASAGVGFVYRPAGGVQLSGSGGFGRTEEKVDSISSRRWITVEAIEISFRGRSLGGVFPSVTVSGECSNNLDVKSGYDLELSAKINLDSGGPFSVSFGYKSEQVYQADLSYRSSNSNAFITIGYDHN